MHSSSRAESQVRHRYLAKQFAFACTGVAHEKDKVSAFCSRFFRLLLCTGMGFLPVLCTEML